MTLPSHLFVFICVYVINFHKVHGRTATTLIKAKHKKFYQDTLHYVHITFVRNLVDKIRSNLEHTSGSFK